jgi:hypothetical protein
VTEPVQTYQRGHASLDLETLYLTTGEHPAQAMQDCVFGLQVHTDGRVWVCINGSTFLRFKPNGKAITDE